MACCPRARVLSALNARVCAVRAELRFWFTEVQIAAAIQALIVMPITTSLDKSGRNLFQDVVQFEREYNAVFSRKEIRKCSQDHIYVFLRYSRGPDFYVLETVMEQSSRFCLDPGSALAFSQPLRFRR